MSTQRAQVMLLFLVRFNNSVRFEIYGVTRSSSSRPFLCALDNVCSLVPRVLFFVGARGEPGNEALPGTYTWRIDGPHLSTNIDTPTCYAKSPAAHAAHVSVNTRPHQLRWGDWKMGTAISCTKRSQVACLIQKVNSRSSSNAPSLCAAVFPCVLL